jgi:hypothetical protein
MPERLRFAAVAMREHVAVVCPRGLMVPRGLRAVLLGVGDAVAHRRAHRIAVVGIGRCRQGNRGGRDADNYRFEDHVMHNAARKGPIGEPDESRTGQPHFLTVS